MAPTPPPPRSRSGAPLCADVVGKSFVLQYYKVMRWSPDEAHMFYHDDSCLARPSAAGAMDIVTTLEAIKRKISEMGRVTHVEIESADSLVSHDGGITVLVTGSITIGTATAAAWPRAFAQSFFLAPQRMGGYYVRNDTFRYVGGAASAGSAAAVAAAVEEENCSNKQSPTSELPAAPENMAEAAALPPRRMGMESMVAIRTRQRAAENLVEAGGHSHAREKLRRALLLANEKKEEAADEQQHLDVAVKNEPEEDDDGYVLLDHQDLHQIKCDA